MKIYFHDVENRTFTLSLNGQPVPVDFSTEAIEIADPASLTLALHQEPQEPLPKWARILWWLTLPLQAVLSIISWYGEDTWYKQINPWLLRLRLRASGNGQDVHIRFIERKSYGFLRTEVECSGAVILETAYAKDHDTIRKAYVRYRRQVISISATSIAFFLWLAFATQSLVCMVIALALLAVTVAGLYVQQGKAKALYQSFWQSQDN